MPTTKNTISNRNNHEKTIQQALKEMVRTDTKVYWILWKFAPELINTEEEIKTYKDLQKAFVCFRHLDEATVNKYIYNEGVQNAIKWLLKRQDGVKMIELYNLYYEKAKTDVQAFKALIDFKKEFFAESEQNELVSILNGVNIQNNDDEDDSDDFIMDEL